MLNQLIEAIGDSTQYSVLAYVVDYVIEPETACDVDCCAVPLVDGECPMSAPLISNACDKADGSGECTVLSNGMVMTILAGALLVTEMLSVPFWTQIVVPKFGKYRAYVIWNVVVAVTCGLKIFAAWKHTNIGLVLAFAMLWGFGVGGSNSILKSLLADAYQHDELVTGDRREASFGVFIDFLGEKMPATFGEVIPLMMMSALGYVANAPQNSGVVWLLRLCFS
eukprot:SAG31_NODE_8230_length_1493_cov_1.398135_2_plen_223_part_01